MSYIKVILSFHHFSKAVLLTLYKTGKLVKLAAVLELTADIHTSLLNYSWIPLNLS